MINHYIVFFFNSAFNMRITLDEIIRRHRENNPYSDCIYTKTVLGKTLHDKVIITCKKHGDFLQAPHEHMKGQGCPICGKEQMKDTKTTDINILIQKSKDMFKEKFSYEETIKTYKNVKTKCKFHCNECNLDFEASFFNHLKSKDGSCPYCKKRRSKLKRAEKIIKQHIANNKKKETQKEIKSNKLKEKETKRAIKENNIKEEIQLKQIEKAKKLKERKKQKEIQKIKRKEESERKRKERNSPENLFKYFNKRVKELKLDEKYDFSYVTDYVNAQTKIPVYCHEKDEFGKEHGIFMIKPTGLFQGKGCPKCAKKYTYTSEELLLKFKALNGDDYVYGNLDGKKMRDKIDIYCNKCHRWFKQELHSHLKHYGCPYCQRSKLERTIDVLLYSNNINYEYQKRFEWLGQQSIDFYIPIINIGIECQGEQHFVVTRKFDKNSLKITIERDKRKKQLCKENNLQLVYFLDKKYNSYMEDGDTYFNKKEDLLNFLQERLENINKN